MRKVLFITNLPSPYKIDFYNELSKNLIVHVAFELKMAKNRNSLWKNSKDTFFKSHYLKSFRIGNENSFSFDVYNLLFEDYDHIILNGWGSLTIIFTAIILKLKKIKYYVSIDGVIEKKTNFFFNFLKKIVINNSKGFFSPSMLSDLYLKNYNVNHSTIYRYPFSSISSDEIVNCDYKFKTAKILKNALNFNNKKIILFVGQFIYRKGIDLLLEASNFFNDDYLFIFVGGKPSDLKKFGYDESIFKNVLLINFLTKEELGKYYLIADLFVLPTREDIWGLVINEALAFGLPVITTKYCNAGLELVNNNNGIIIDVLTVENIVCSINKIIGSRNLYDICIYSNKKIKEFTIETMSHHFLQVLK